MMIQKNKRYYKYLQLLALIKMKGLTFLLAMTLLSQNLFSQDETIASGIYQGYRDTFSFNQDSVSFSIWSNGGIIYPMKGTGTFEVSNDILLLRTHFNPKWDGLDKTVVELGDTEYLEDRTLVFHLIEYDEYSINFTLIGIIENSMDLGKKEIKAFLKDDKKMKFRERQIDKKN